MSITMSLLNTFRIRVSSFSKLAPTSWGQQQPLTLEFSRCQASSKTSLKGHPSPSASKSPTKHLRSREHSMTNASLRTTLQLTACLASRTQKACMCRWLFLWMARHCPPSWSITMALSHSLLPLIRSAVPTTWWSAFQMESHLQTIMPSKSMCFLHSLKFSIISAKTLNSHQSVDLGQSPRVSSELADPRTLRQNWV